MGQRIMHCWCNACGRNTSHAQEAPTHLLHFLITILACGLWIPVWIGVTIAAANGEALCTQCGSKHVDPAVLKERGELKGDSDG